MPAAKCSLQDDLNWDRMLSGKWLKAINDITLQRLMSFIK